MRLLSSFRVPGAAVLAAVAALGATAVQAQTCPDWRLNGTLVTTDAQTVWTPQEFGGTAGGPLDLSACTSVPGLGHITEAPSYTITYDAQDRGYDLDFRVASDCDTVLLINDATAEWHFNDDEDGTLNARIRLSAARSGVYDVWVGTFGPTSCPATLVLETFPPAAPAEGTGAEAAACPDWQLGGAEVNLVAGAAETRPVVAGGSVNLHERAQACGIEAHGHVAPAPDFTLYYQAPQADAELRLGVTADCDTVLLVNDLNAAWLFNDDTDGLNPAISIPAAASGRYDIWVGTFGADLCQAQIDIASVLPAAPAAPQAPTK